MLCTVPEPKAQLNYPAGMSFVCFINLTFPELTLQLCASLCIPAKLYMLMVCFLDAVANCWFLNNFLVLRYALKKVHMTSLGALGRQGGGLWREKE